MELFSSGMSPFFGNEIFFALWQGRCVELSQEMMISDLCVVWDVRLVIGMVDFQLKHK